MNPSKTLAVSILAALATPAFAWEPSRPVEIVVPAGAGGATDQMARMFQAAIQNNDLLDVSTVVSLKGGASGAEGLLDMTASSGDPHKFIIANLALYTLPISTNLPFDWRTLTPVAVVAQDQFVLWASSDSAYSTAPEFVEAAKAAGENTLRMGGTGSMREDHILTSAFQDATGTTFSYIPYGSGGEAATQLVGKHTEANVNNPSESAAVWRAGQVKPICVFSGERLPYEEMVTESQSWSSIPTCGEQGVDIEFSMLRAIFVPGEVTPEQADFYVDLFQKITETPEYQDYMKLQALTPAFLTGDEMTAFLEQDEARTRELMTAAGFVASN